MDNQANLDPEGSQESPRRLKWHLRYDAGPSNLRSKELNSEEVPNLNDGPEDPDVQRKRTGIPTKKNRRQVYAAEPLGSS